MPHSNRCFDDKFNALTHAIKSNIRHSDIIKSLVGVISVGKPTYEAIDEFRSDEFFTDSMEISKVPSPTNRAIWIRSEGVIERSCSCPDQKK